MWRTLIKFDELFITFNEHIIKYNEHSLSLTNALSSLLIIDLMLWTFVKFDEHSKSRNIIKLDETLLKFGEH